MTDINRRLPICVFSLPEWSTDPRDTALDVQPILNSTAGAAHIVLLSGPASQLLTESVGKEWSVYHRAVRTYWPKIDLETSDPFQHLLTTLSRMDRWPDGPEGFGKVLIDSLLRATISYRYVEEALPTYANVRRMEREHLRQIVVMGETSEREQLDQARQDYEELQQQLDEEKEELYGFVSEAESERDQARSQLNDAQEQINALNARVYYLESLQVNDATPDHAEMEIPEDFDALEEWGKRHLAGKVVLHNRAIRAARKSKFEDVPLAYRALLILRDHYIPMKREGGIELRRTYDEALQKMGLEDSEPFTGTRAGQAGEDYFVEFAGHKRYLERHLKGSNSRDERYAFRLYFFWDDDSEQVVVGSLPGHLYNPRLS